MHLGMIKSLAICAFAGIAVAGCASSPSSSSTVTSAASAQGGLKSGKVTAVETVAVVDQALVGTSSGNSAVVTTASGGPQAITVLFNDGSEGRYVIERPSVAHRVGETVYVITDGDRTGIMRQ